MIDFDKMTKEEHEQYREMERKAQAFDRMRETASVVIDDIYERETIHADLGYQALGRELTVIMDNCERTD